MVAVADPWEGPGYPGPPLFLDQTEARRAENNVFEPPPLSQGLDDRPSTPYLKVWISHWVEAEVEQHKRPKR